MKVHLTSALVLGTVFVVGSSQPASAIVTQPISPIGHQDNLILARGGHHGGHHGGHRGHHGGHHGRGHHGWGHHGWGGGYWGPGYNNWGYAPACRWVNGFKRCY